MADIAVVTGVGGMGSAIARRIGAGRRLALLDIDGEKSERVAAELRASGHDVVSTVADVADRAAVQAFADSLTGDRIVALVHTAGLSGSMAGADRIMDVNLLGTALVIDAFEPLMGPGSAAVFIASMGSITFPVGPDLAQRYAHAPTDELVGIMRASRDKPYAPVEAYCLSKRANQLRVNAAAIRWGRNGARINSISPGIIATPMGDLEARHVPQMAIMREISPIQRIGTPDDIAQAVEFLLGVQASFITGIDLPVDGGVIAAQLYGGRNAF